MGGQVNVDLKDITLPFSVLDWPLEPKRDKSGKVTKKAEGTISFSLSNNTSDTDHLSNGGLRRMTKNKMLFQLGLGKLSQRKAMDGLRQDKKIFYSHLQHTAGQHDLKGLADAL